MNDRQADSRAARAWRIATRWVAAVVIAIGSGGVSGAALDAFSAEVAVVDRGSVELGEAFELAFREVLLANSGDKTLLNRDDIRRALTEPRRYVDQFRYRTPEPGTLISRETPVTQRVLASGQATQLLLVRFDAARVQALIDAEPAAPAAVEAPAERPAPPSAALIWMLIEDDEREFLVGGNTVTNVQRRLREIAGGAGFALAFPRAEALGEGAVTADDLRLLDPVDAAERVADEESEGSPVADRDAPDAGTAAEVATEVERLRAVLPVATRAEDRLVAVAHLQRLPLGGWQARWLNLGMEVADATGDTFRTDTLDAALQRGLAGLAPTLDAAIRFDRGEMAAGPNLDEGLVWIGALGDARDYADALRFLDTIDSVALVYPKLVDGDGMLFAVVPRDAVRDVDRAVRSDPAFRIGAPRMSGNVAPLTRQAELTLDFVGR